MMHLAELINLADCPRLSEKYAGILALPLALPKFELDSVDEFWNIWNAEQARVDRQHIDRGAVGKDPSTVSKAYTQWDGLALYEDETLLGKAAWVTKVSPKLASSQPNYTKAIFEQLPFVKIRSIRLWSSTCVIPAHYDGNMPASLDGKMHFPTEIRIMVDDQNPNETFYLAPVSKHKPHTIIPQEDRYYVRLPSDTNTFAWNNEDYLHGADYNPPHKKILAVIKGWIDTNKLEALLDKSIQQYPDFILREKHD
jgi:hypothetical protein